MSLLQRRILPARTVGFYGLDLYSLHASMQAVLAYLHRVDPRAAERAGQRYACFEDLSLSPQAYGYAASFGLTRDSEDEARGPARRAPALATRQPRA